MNEHETEEIIALSADEQQRLVGGDCGGGNLSYCAGKKIGALFALVYDTLSNNPGRAAVEYVVKFG